MSTCSPITIGGNIGSEIGWITSKWALIKAYGLDQRSKKIGRK
jgi:hypothetical protein